MVASRDNNVFCLQSKYFDWIAILSCSLAFCCYLNTLSAGFVYDDSRAILTNKDVLRQETSWKDIFRDDFWGTPLSHSGSHKSFRPLTILSFRVNRHLAGFHPWSYHLTNVLLHTLTTWLFVRVGRVVFNISEFQWSSSSSSTASGKPKGSQNLALLVATLLFASHPIHTEAVAGVVGRADVAATAFALASFLAYANHVKRREKVGRLKPSLKTPSGDSGCGRINASVVSTLYLLLAVGFAAASMFSKEHGIMIFFICAAYDLLLSVVRCRGQGCQSLLATLRELECSRSVVFLALSFVALFHLRLSAIGGLSAPTFAKADNPASHDPSFWVRTMTFLFLPVLNFSLLIYPHPLSYDWSMDAVPKIEKMCDSRNLLSLAFYYFLIRQVRLSVKKLRHNSHSPKLFPAKLNNASKVTCRICWYATINQKCSNNNSIVLQNETDKFQSQHKINFFGAQKVPQHRNMNNNSKVNHHSYGSSNCHSSFTSGSPNRASKSSILQIRHCSSVQLENAAILLEMAFMVLPFLPATNMFLYVGFVVAERVLYFSSVGYCLLIGHGFSYLNHKSENLKKGTSLTKATILAALVATVVMMSLGTIRRNEDWNDEGKLYRAGIKVNPPKSWGNLGNVLNSQGKVIEAEEAYRNALHYRPNMAEVHYNLGLVLERQGKVEEALMSYRTSIHFRSQLASAYVNAGQLLTRLGRINQAMDMYRKCFNLNDDGVKDLRTHIEAKVSALLRFGKLLIEIEDAPKAAVKVYRQAVKIMPSDYDQKQSVYNAIGEALFRVGEIAEAEGWFLEALKTKPDHVPAHLTYGKMLARNKTRLLEAERWFRRAKKIAPLDSTVYHHYGQFLAVQGRHPEAATAYVTAASLSPNDYDIVVGAANALRQSGNNKEAEVYYEKAVALRSQEARAHMNLGAILHVNGKYHEAEQSYLMALRLKPSDDVTLMNLKKLRQLQARRKQFSMSCKSTNNNNDKSKFTKHK